MCTQRFRLAALALAASGLVATAASGQSNVIESGGSTVGAPTAMLPLFGSTPGACVLADTPEPYEPTDVTTDRDGTHVADAYETVQTIPDTDDTVILVYADAFDPSSACVNFVGIGNKTPGGGLSIDLTAGGYVLVVAGFLGTEDAYAVRVTGPAGSTLTSDRVTAGDDLPEAAALALGAAYPNPSASGTTVPFGLAEAGPVRLSVFDALGREVLMLADGTIPAGLHSAPLRSGVLPAGTYLIQLAAEGTVLTRSLTISR